MQEHTFFIAAVTPDGTAIANPVEVAVRGSYLRFQSSTDGHDYVIPVEGAFAALIRDTATGPGGVHADRLYPGLPQLVPPVQPAVPWSGPPRSSDPKRHTR